MSLTFQALTLLVVAVVIPVEFAGLPGVIADFILLRTLRWILYGLVTTCITGPGAPQWAENKAKQFSPALIFV